MATTGPIKRTMTLKAWAAIPNCPYQRDTEKHALKALRTHLAQEHTCQHIVHMAEFPDGTRCKVDGHSRTFLWLAELLGAPEKVTVMVWFVDSEDELRTLYHTFDAQTAAESNSDRVASLLREFGMLEDYPHMQYFPITSMARLLIADGDKEKSARDFIQYWESELLQLADLNIQRNRMPAALLATATLTLRVYGNKAVEFWTRYKSKNSYRANGQQDGVELLLKLFEQRKRDKLLQGPHAAELAARALTCVDLFVADRTYQSSQTIPRAADWQKRMAQAVVYAHV